MRHLLNAAPYSTLHRINVTFLLSYDWLMKLDMKLYVCVNLNLMPKYFEADITFIPAIKGGHIVIIEIKDYFLFLLLKKVSKKSA